METSKTYFCSSSCWFQVFDECGEGKEEDEFFFSGVAVAVAVGVRVGTVARKKNHFHTPLTESTRSRYAEKNTSVSPSGTTPPPTSGLFIQSVAVVVDFIKGKKESGKKGDVEVGEV